MADVDRFMAKVVKDEKGCWVWTGAKGAGYGIFSVKRVNVGAHRWSYSHFNNVDLPKGHGQHIDHLCRNKMCVNPAHLELVTAKLNAQRRNSVKTHCRQGHEFSDENTYADPRGWRGCRICRVAATYKRLAKLSDPRKR